MLQAGPLSIDEICAYLGINRDTFYEWIKTNSLPADRLGRLWKFKKEEVDGWLQKKAS